MKKLFITILTVVSALLDNGAAQLPNEDQNILLQEAQNEGAQANSLWERQDYKSAQLLHERVLRIYEKILGPENPKTGVALNNLANDYRDMQNYLKAEELYKRALPIYEKGFGMEHSETACALNNQANNYFMMGYSDKALPLHKKASVIYEKVLGLDNWLTANALANLSNDYSTLGNDEKALPLQQKALAIFEKVLGPMNTKTGMALSNLAGIYLSTGNYVKALPLYERALSIFEKSLGPKHAYTINSLTDLAICYGMLDDHAKALAFFERAMAISEQVLSRQNPDRAHIFTWMGSEYVSIGNYAKAVPLYERALAIDEKALRAEDPQTLFDRLSLAKCQYIIGKDWASFQKTLSQVYLGRELALQGILVMDEQTRLAWEQKNLQLPMLDLLGDSQRCTYILRTKGIVLDSLIEDHNALKKLAPDSLEVKEVASARHQIGKLAFSAKNTDQKEVSRLKERIDTILSSVAGQRSKVGRVRQAASITSDTVATALPIGGILLEFIQFTDPKIKGDAGRCYGALILGKDGEPKFVRIDDATGIDSSVRALRNAIPKCDEKALVDQQKILSEKLWAPIAKILPEGTKKLFIGADGQLNFLSFAALPAQDGSFLAERYDIAYVGSGRDLARKVSTSDSKTITLFADPVFELQSSSYSTNALALRSGELDEFGKIVLPPLPGTRAEEAVVEEIAKSSGWSPDAHLGERAAKSDLMALKSPGILHLATHGFYLNTLTQNGGGEGTERGMKVMESLDSKKPASTPKIDPMHASGIALTGAQSTLKAWSEGRVPNSKEDGILTAEEVAGLDLDGTWLVTLSACETGVGEARSGEGVFGLRRAFMMAGAQNLLMTLWPVSDEMTPKIMADFYKEALATHDAAGALAKVQRDWLVKLKKEKGLLAAVRDAGPFAMVVMANPNLGKTSPVTQPSSSPSRGTPVAPTPPTAPPSPSPTPVQVTTEKEKFKKAA